MTSPRAISESLWWPADLRPGVCGPWSLVAPGMTSKRDGVDEPAFRRLSLLRRLLTRRRVRQLERLHWEHNQRFAWYVQEILAG